MRLLVFAVMFFSKAFAMDPKIAVITEKNFPAAMSGKDRVLPHKPDDKEIAQLEADLETFLKKQNPKLAAKFKNYYRQYSGITVPARKETTIRGNFMCKVSGEGWKEEFLITFDGGDCYFQFIYKLETRKFENFSVNGNS